MHKKQIQPRKERYMKLIPPTHPKAEVTASNAPDPLPHVPFIVSLLVVEIEIELVALI
jgi:hypothetical protein